MYSIIIPVYRESSVLLNALVRHLKRICRHDDCEIIIVGGAPDSDFAESMRGNGVSLLASKEQSRARQMNLGARAAQGDILVFLHADCLPPENFPGRIASVFKNPRFAAGAFGLKLNSRKLIFRFISAAASLRSRISRIPYGDQAFFIRTRYFFEIGGFMDIPIMEDVELMKRIRKRGNAVAILPDRVLASPRRWEREGILWYTLKVRIMNVLFACGVDPERLARFYYGDRAHTAVEGKI